MSKRVGSCPFVVVVVVVSVWALLLCRAPVARACGGFFCGQQPVDQTAERIVFKVGPNAVTMIVQIAYAGAAPDFAWVLPLVEVPDIKSLGVFPQRALTALDANTGPRFVQPDACARDDRLSGASRNAVPAAESDAGVMVHYRAEVGPYDVAAIESSDPMALFEWLIRNGFNVQETMLPYIRSYTDAGMKFIALKLKQGEDSSDIQPFRFDLPGESPSIPLRMTALAAEPEMGILVFVFADQRYSGANWPDIAIRDDQIVLRNDSFPPVTNWTALVARGVDQAGGLGWVTELAGSSAPLKTAITNSGFISEEDEQAATQLLALIGDASYVSRLYSRLSPEEMTVDPVFHRTNGGDVSNMHKLVAKVKGVDQCAAPLPPPDPCLFTSCGAGGICRPVMMEGRTTPIAGCGCLDGAAARTTFDPTGVSLQTASSVVPSATVACQDVRLSFVNPGDTVGGAAMPDPCANFDCGPDGSCTAVNMTPTCVCDRGYVAVGSFASDGTRTTRCRVPMIAVPTEFYRQRLPDLPADLPGGREFATDTSVPVVQPRMDDLGSSSGAVPGGVGGDDGGCAVHSGRSGAGQTWAVLASATLVAVWTRRRAQPKR